MPTLCQAFVKSRASGRARHCLRRVITRLSRRETRGPSVGDGIGRVHRGGRLCVQFASQGSRVTVIISGEANAQSCDMPGVMWSGGGEGGRIEQAGVCARVCKAVMEESRNGQQ